MAKSKILKKILITGAQGYIGTRLIQKLNKKYKIIATDNGYFKTCTIGNYKDPIKVYKMDIRHFKKKIIEGIDTVIHLGALSNDPSSEINHNITKEINFKSTVKLAKLAKNCGVKKFIFSSSCIMYGTNYDAKVNEDSDLRPRTVYAKSKVWAEKALSKLADKNFSPIFVRNGTIYGFSPRMRFDTVLNNFFIQYYSTGKIDILSRGEQYRPVIHLDDVIKALDVFINAPKSKIHNKAFNTGSNKNNLKIIELAKIVKKTFPKTKLNILNEKNHDNRSYITSFNKISQAFPNIKFSNNYSKKLIEMNKIFLKYKVSKNIIKSDKFTRLKWLNNLKVKKLINKNLTFNKKKKKIIK